MKLQTMKIKRKINNFRKMLHSHNKFCQIGDWMFVSLAGLTQRDALSRYEIGWTTGMCGSQCGRGNYGVIFHMS